MPLTFTVNLKEVEFSTSYVSAAKHNLSCITLLNLTCCRKAPCRFQDEVV